MPLNQFIKENSKWLLVLLFSAGILYSEMQSFKGVEENLEMEIKTVEERLSKKIKIIQDNEDEMASIEEEAKADLFSEQSLLCSVLPYAGLSCYNKLREKGVSKEMAYDYGATGPRLRGSGIDWDLRRDEPYSLYSEVEFDVEVGIKVVDPLDVCHANA